MNSGFLRLTSSDAGYGLGNRSQVGGFPKGPIIADTIFAKAAAGHAQMSRYEGADQRTIGRWNTQYDNFVWWP
jgi:hypothetical protein